MKYSATVASICRLHSLYIVDISTDITWDNPGSAIWSAIELNVGILCASLPTLRALFIEYWPRAFLSSFSFRATPGESHHTAKGEYYNMEGSILVKKTIAIESTGDTEAGSSGKPQFLSSHADRTEIRGGSLEGERGISASPRY